MMVVLLVAGLGLLLAGLLAIGYGIPINEFGFGNTLIVAGTVSACTGMIMLGLWMVVRELKNIAQQFSPGVPMESHAGTALQSASAISRSLAPENTGSPQPAAPSSAPSPAPWHQEAASRDRMPSLPEPVEGAPSLKPRRNLLFSSSSRKERERAQARTTDPSAADLLSPSSAAPPASESSAVPPATFENGWPRSERARPVDVPPQRRSSRAPSTFTEADETAADRNPPAARDEDQPPVTVLKSGVVDGMAYSLFSDGSIEAQMPEGMMRFASIDELRTHLDQRS